MKGGEGEENRGEWRYEEKARGKDEGDGGRGGEGETD